MPLLNKASLFQLTLNSQLNITVSAHVCVLMYMPWIHVYFYISYDMCVHVCFYNYVLE